MPTDRPCVRCGFYRVSHTPRMDPAVCHSYVRPAGPLLTALQTFLDKVSRW